MIQFPQRFRTSEHTVKLIRKERDPMRGKRYWPAMLFTFSCLLGCGGSESAPVTSLQALQRRIDEQAAELVNLRQALATPRIRLAAAQSQSTKGTERRAVPGEKVLSLHRLCLVDKSGKPRAELSVRPDGSPALEFYAAGGQRRATLGLGTDGEPSMQLMDEDGKVRLAVGKGVGASPYVEIRDELEMKILALGVRDDGSPSVELFNREGKRRVALVVTQDDTAGLAFYDNSGKPRGTFGLELGMRPSLTFYDDQGNVGVAVEVTTQQTPCIELRKGGKLHAVLGLEPDDKPFLCLSGDNPAHRIALRLAGNGTPNFEFFDADGTCRAILNAMRDGVARLTLFDKAGKMAFQTP